MEEETILSTVERKPKGLLLLKVLAISDVSQSSLFVHVYCGACVDILHSRLQYESSRIPSWGTFEDKALA